MPKVHRSSKDFFWLQWDGSYSAAGTCNAAGPPLLNPPAPPPPALAPIPRLFRAPLPTVAATHVSVRVLDGADDFDPAAHRLRIPIQIKNPGSVQELLFRLHDSAGTVRYQERLVGNPALLLPRIDPLHQAALLAGNTASCFVAVPFGHVPPPLATGAHRGKGPYRVEVWVSSVAGAFLGLGPAAVPAVAYPHTVHDTYEPTTAERTAKVTSYATGGESVFERFQRNSRARTKRRAGAYDPAHVTAARGLPKLRVAHHEVNTNAGTNQWAPGKTDGWRTRVEQMFRAIDLADAEFERCPLANAQDEIRLFVAPEWYFRNPKTGGDVLSHAQMLQIVQTIRNRSAAPKYNRWLIVPGTIFFGIGYASYDAYHPNAGMLTNIDDYLMNPFALGAPGPRAHQAGSKIFYIANLMPVIHAGALVHYTVKENRNEDERSDEFWGMYTMARALRPAARHPRTFLHNGVLFGVEICRDHDVAVAHQEYVAGGGGPGVDVELVVSFSVPRQARSLFTRDGGWFIQNDGQARAGTVYNVAMAGPGGAGFDPAPLTANWARWFAGDSRMEELFEGIVSRSGEITRLQNLLAARPSLAATLNPIITALQLDLTTNQAAALLWPEWGAGAPNSLHTASVPALLVSLGLNPGNMGQWGQLIQEAATVLTNLKSALANTAAPHVRAVNPLPASQVINHQGRLGNTTLKLFDNIDLDTPIIPLGGRGAATGPF